VDVENVSNGLRWRRLEPKKRLKRPAVRVRALVEGVPKQAPGTETYASSPGDKFSWQAPVLLVIIDGDVSWTSRSLQD
jgi:hypothetical protein